MMEEHVGQALLRFHLGASDDGEHARVDGHLIECRPCLVAYFALKRQFDSASAFEERPSPLVRERLRREVVRRLPRTLSRPRTWAVAAAIAAAVLVMLWVRAQYQGSRSSGETLIDTGPGASVAQVL